MTTKPAPYKINDRALSWVPPEQIEDQALEQIRNISGMPFVFRHVAVMPDCHFGMGATVGSCIPTKDAIIPAAVGVDIGCGMIAVRTSLTKDDMPEDLADLRVAIESRIPLSAGRYNGRVRKTARPRVERLEQKAGDRLPFYDKISKNWRKQLGSLGSGNHFIEIVLDEDDGVWAFLHSGSRGVGNRIATHHIREAKALTEKAGVELPDKDLAYLTGDTDEFDDYIRDLDWAQYFALLNREEMMERVLGALRYRAGDFEEIENIQCHHNFTQKESHFGEDDIWVTRKGAIQALDGQMGLIPGSMGTASYVVRGKGDAESFQTAPHGAGRRFSRRRARENFDMDDFD